MPLPLSFLLPTNTRPPLRLDVAHPIAKLLVLASQQQEAELGDGSALVVMLAGELLHKAEYLITMGLHPSEILQGYELARDKALQELESE